VLFRGTLGADYEKGKKHVSWLFQQNAGFKLLQQVPHKVYIWLQTVL
jgi:hypothetical protein